LQRSAGPLRRRLHHQGAGPQFLALQQDGLHHRGLRPEPRTGSPLRQIRLLLAIAVHRAPGIRGPAAAGSFYGGGVPCIVGLPNTEDRTPCRKPDASRPSMSPSKPSMPSSSITRPTPHSSATSTPCTCAS